jgi:hypothetical protein
MLNNQHINDFCNSGNERSDQGDGSLRNLIMVRSGSRRGIDAQATVLYKRIQASVKAKFSG